MSWKYQQIYRLSMYGDDELEQLQEAWLDRGDLHEKMKVQSIVHGDSEGFGDTLDRGEVSGERMVDLRDRPDPEA